MDFVQRLNLCWSIRNKDIWQKDAQTEHTHTRIWIDDNFNSRDLTESDAMLLHAVIQEGSIILGMPMLDRYNSSDLNDFTFVQVPGPITGVSLLRTIHLFYQQTLTTTSVASTVAQLHITTTIAVCSTASRRLAVPLDGWTFASMSCWQALRR